MPPASRIVDWRQALTALAALDTGLLERFEGGADPAEAARAAGLDERASRIVAAALVASGHLERDGGLIRTTERGAALLRPPADGADPAGALHLEARAIRNHLGLAETLRTGRAPDDVSGGDRDTRERFLRAMRDVSAPRAAAVVDAVGPPPPGGRLLDVGGAPGTHARAFAAAGWEVTVVDLPEMLAIGEPDLRAAGVACVPGDATTALPDGPWDVVHLGNIVHLFGPETAAALVARAAAALAPGGLLAIGEVLGDLGGQGPEFGVMMLVSTPGGDAYTVADHRGWMAAAGCPLERVVEIEEGWHHLLLGRRR